MEEKQSVLVYFSSIAEIDKDIEESFEKQAKLILVSSVSEMEDIINDYKNRVVLIAIDLRKEEMNGSLKMEKVCTSEIISNKPMVVICEHNALAEFSVGIKYGAEIINLPVDKEALIRRCNRACKMTNIDMKKD